MPKSSGFKSIKIYIYLLFIATVRAQKIKRNTKMQFENESNIISIFLSSKEVLCCLFMVPQNSWHKYDSYSQVVVSHPDKLFER